MNKPLPPEEIDLPESFESEIEEINEPILRAENLMFGDFLHEIENSARRTINEHYQNHRKSLLQAIQSTRNSTVIAYYSVDIFDMEDATQIWEILSAYPESGNVDLFLLSPGGITSAAFKVARMIQERTAKTNGRFGVLIPYYAKSAATILALGADEIIMGPASELGPIDPQVPVNGEYISLLALQDAIEFLKGETKDNPEASAMFWPLVQRIDLHSLGHYQREVESAEQYATLLLEARMFKANHKLAASCAKNLVSNYKTHGHVIDRQEAKSKLGLNVVDADDDLYQQMWQLHKLYDIMVKKSINNNETVKIIETVNFLVVRNPSIPPDTTSFINPLGR